MGRRLSLLLLSLLAVVGAQAQGVRIPAQVVGVAGSEAYLDRGTADGLAPGDTVGVERAGAIVGGLVVLQATARRSVTTFAGAPFALTRGEQITLLLRAADPIAPDPPAVPDTLRPPRASILGGGRAGPQQARAPMLVTGRLQTGVQALQSSTDPGGGEVVRRTFAMPFASLRADVTGVPGGVRLHLNGRTTVRYSDAPGSTSVTDLFLYQASVEVGGRLLHAEAGRFLSDYERTSGYWDGVGLRLGTDGAGVGGTVGFQPGRTNGRPDGSLPKAAAYAYLSHRADGLRADASVNGGHLFTERGASFVGASGAASYRADAASLRASAHLLADATAADGWSLARASTRAALRVGPADLALGYSHYRPSLLTTAAFPLGLSFLSVARETVSARVGLRYRRRGPEVYADVARYRRGGAADGRSVGGGLRVGRLPGLPVGVSLDVSSNDRSGFRLRFAAARASAQVRAASLGLAYRLSQVDLADETRTTHGVEGSASAPLSRRVGVSVLAGMHGGGGLRRSSVYSSVWVRL